VALFFSPVDVSSGSRFCTSDSQNLLIKVKFGQLELKVF
jgi:hypothetical protein